MTKAERYYKQLSWIFILLDLLLLVIMHADLAAKNRELKYGLLVMLTAVLGRCIYLFAKLSKFLDESTGPAT